MPKPLIVLVGADKGGVGKTMVCRVLIDYLRTRGAAPSMIDTEPAPGVLSRFWPEAKLINVDKVAGQMKVFDQIGAAKVTVVDIRAGLLSPTLAAMRDVGLLQDATNGELTIAVLHVLGPTVASLSEVERVSAVLGDAPRYFLVKNYVNDSEFFEWEGKRFADLSDSATAMVIVPHLNELACETLEAEGVSHEAFVANRNARGQEQINSRTLRGYVRHWLDQVYANMDQAAIGQLLKL